jgi:hypothetical protein
MSRSDDDDTAQDGPPLYWCAGASCPGLPWKASDRPHPVSCLGEHLIREDDEPDFSGPIDGSPELLDEVRNFLDFSDDAPPDPSVRAMAAGLEATEKALEPAGRPLALEVLVRVGPSDFGASLKVPMPKGCDVLILCRDRRYGYEPFRLLLPHQVYEANLRGFFDSETEAIVAIPASSKHYVKLAARKVPR